MTGSRNETWPVDTWENGGGATWLDGTYDPATRLIYFGTGNPAPWNTHMRPGDNLWTASRIALDPVTDEMKWEYRSSSTRCACRIQTSHRMIRRRSIERRGGRSRRASAW